MNDEQKNKIKLAIANSFLQTATVQQTLAILQEKALERAQEELDKMDEKAMEEVLTNIRAQEIAQELRSEDTESSESSESTEEDQEAVEN
tara:strand:+ start:18049 stop:18318 length:270 start_codon:yes stop_codon:yes gene_type:complete